VSLPIALPDPLRSAVAEYAWMAATDGESGAMVYRLEAAGRPTLYVKHGTGAVGDGIMAEAARLDWLAGRLPVPRLRHFVRVPGEAYLLTEAVPGQNAYACLEQHPEHAAEIVAELARFLRVVHALPLADCPFHAGHELEMAEARRNVDAGRVNADDFDEERQGWPAEQVWAEMVGLLPLPFERVVTHGDFTLDNVLLVQGRVTGCVDVAGAGAADPYRDLAAMWNTLADFGPDRQRAFIRAYGLAVPDARRLNFHLCLGEFR
jgi:aminoglycoside 3'-phosphotransferase-1